jgi:hypothetical protein
LCWNSYLFWRSSIKKKIAFFSVFFALTVGTLAFADTPVNEAEKLSALDSTAVMSIDSTLANAAADTTVDNSEDALFASISSVALNEAESADVKGGVPWWVVPLIVTALRLIVAVPAY